MRMLTYKLLVVTLLAISFLSDVYSQARQSFVTNSKSIDIISFDKEIEKIIADVGIPGISLAIIDNNKIVYNNGYGYKGVEKKEKVNKETIFEGCSLSKSLLAFVAYQLVDEKKLDLDRPLCEYLEYNLLTHDPRYRLITARMILSHSSGIENYRYANNSKLLEILTDPGVSFTYSGEGYVYLSKVIETILNQTYEEYITQRVINKIGLKNTFLKFEKNKDAPSNYAIGHNILGKELKKWKNYSTNPMGGNSFTAEDYAKLIVSIFDSSQLSGNRIKDILQPIVKIESSNIYYGPGFEISFSNADTIIAHGGDNSGFKALMFYSKVKKSGIVILTNHDIGKSIATKICELSIGINVKPYVEGLFNLNDQYPSTSLKLLNIYKHEGHQVMFDSIDVFKKANMLHVNTLSNLGEHLINYDAESSRKIFEKNILFYPKSPISYYFLGQIYMEKGEYDIALRNLIKAKKLKFDLWSMELDFKKCESEIKKRSMICSSIKTIGDVSKIEAEDYCSMKGVATDLTDDIGGGEEVAWIDTDDYMDYNVNVSVEGTYALTFRVASLPGGAKVQLRLGSSILTTLDIASTKGWETWTSLIGKVNLPAGRQTLRVYASTGGFNLNWLSFTKLTN